MKKYRVGYTAGVFDMFHIGHLNLLRNSRQYCDSLIVGVNSDRLVQEYKSKRPVISENDRLAIVAAIKYVDKALLVDTLDKTLAWQRLGFDAIFIGDDWKDNPRWIKTKVDLATVGVDVIFLPYTKGISSTQEREFVERRIGE